jgi:hypothetical protein
MQVGIDVSKMVTSANCNHGLCRYAASTLLLPSSGITTQSPTSLLPVHVLSRCCRCMSNEATTPYIAFSKST